MTDLESLLSPIRNDSPSGENIRLVPADLTLRRVEQLRSELVAAEDPDGKGRASDWAAVARECEKVLVTRSKDLQFGGWLTEAWTHLRGFAGMRDGLRLLTALAERFWVGLHPGFEGGAIDVVVRTRPLNWLASGRGFLPAVDACSFGSTADGRPLTWQSYQAAQKVDLVAEIPDKTRFLELAKQGHMRSSEWIASLRATGPEAILGVHANVGECEEALAELVRVVGKQLDEDGDTLNVVGLAGRLRDIRDYLDRFVEPPVAPPEPETEVPVAVTPSAAAHETRMVRDASAIASREDALQILSQVAAYFRKSEPHSPIAALIARAVRWGSMPFEQVLREVLRDESALTRMWDVLGVRPEDKGS